MYSCQKCGGAVGEPGKAYGYAGKWCYCPEPTQPLVWQDGIPPRPSIADILKGPSGPIVRMPPDPQPFLQWLRGYLDAGGSDMGRIAAELNKVLS